MSTYNMEWRENGSTTNRDVKLVSQSHSGNIVMVVIELFLQEEGLDTSQWHTLRAERAQVELVKLCRSWPDYV